MSFCVELDIYFGPMDLLLYLVRRNEVDILDLPIARITGQFVEYLDVLKFLDFDVVGDFVVMASTLAEIKSRMVLPGPAEEPVDQAAANDPRSDLIRQLLEYKKYKDAAAALEERAAVWHDRFPRLANDRPAGGRDLSVDRIKEVELWDLVSALSRLLRQTAVEEQASIRFDDTPMSVYLDQVSTRVRAEGRVAFSSFFEGATQRQRIVGLFLAVLELIRHHGFRAQQPTDFGEIWIVPPADDPASKTAAPV